MKKFFNSIRVTAVLTAIVFVSFLSACSLDASKLVNSIVNEYAISAAQIGDKYTQLETKSTIKYETADAVYNESYTLKYQRKNGIDVFNLLDTRQTNPQTFEGGEYSEYYYNGWRTAVLRTDGLDTTVVSPERVTDVFGGGNSLLNYLSLRVRYYLPGETLDINTLENVTAKRSGSGIIVRASGKAEELANIRAAYFKSLPTDSLENASYSGSKGMKSLTSITFEYFVKNNRIIRKKVVMEGKMIIVVNSSGVDVDAKMTHEVEYLYSSSPVIHQALEGRS